MILAETFCIDFFRLVLARYRAHDIAIRVFLLFVLSALPLAFTVRPEFFFELLLPLAFLQVLGVATPAHALAGLPVRAEWTLGTAGFSATVLIVVVVIILRRFAVAIPVSRSTTRAGTARA